MRRMFVYAALLAVGVAPALAERLYVPVVSATDAPTQVWVNRMSKATRVAMTRNPGLIAVDGDRAGVVAWVNDADLTMTPVWSERDAYHAGAAPGTERLGNDYDRLLVGAANMSDTAATCTATLYSADDRELARIPFDVAPRALYREDAAAWTSARVATAEVTCNREFHPLAVTTSRQNTKVVYAKTTGANGPCQHIVVPVKQNDGSYVVDLPGVFHQATAAHAKGIVCIRAPADVKDSTWRVGVATMDWDFLVGPWYAKRPSGIHNLGYFFAERYRAGVIGNFNGMGPKKYQIKNMQNFGMPKGHNTNVKGPYTLQKDAIYHATYTFDANHKTAVTELKNTDGAVLKTLRQNTSPGGQTLSLTKYRSQGQDDMVMIAEFGNYPKTYPGFPEVPTLGWLYGNLHIRFVNK